MEDKMLDSQKECIRKILKQCPHIAIGKLVEMFDTEQWYSPNRDDIYEFIICEGLSREFGQSAETDSETEQVAEYEVSSKTVEENDISEPLKIDSTKNSLFATESTSTEALLMELNSFPKYFWEDVVWSGELTKSYQLRGQDFRETFWGFYTVQGLGKLVHIDHSMTKEAYENIIYKELIPSWPSFGSKAVLMHTNITAHLCLFDTVFKQNNIRLLWSKDCNNRVIDWSPLKKISAAMNEFINPTKNWYSREDFIESILNAWNRFDKKMAAESVDEFLSKIKRKCLKINRF